MKRALSFVLVAVFLTMAVASIPNAQATHEWGHRFMILGRILDDNGDPAQQLPIRVTVSTTKDRDPYMTINTDCFGLFYSQKINPNQSGAYGTSEDWGLEGNVMHIHTSEYRPDSEYSILSQYGNYTARADREEQHAQAKIRFEKVTPPVPACDDPSIGTYESRYVVGGRVQTDKGTTREDMASIHGVEINVTVTIQTADGPVTKSQLTNRYGDYIIQFENVSVAKGDRITARWAGQSSSGTADTTYRFTPLDIIQEELSTSEAITRWFFLAIGGAIVVGILWWSWNSFSDKMAVKRASKSSGRKRAN